ncbi:MAG: GNAT family N-acetyltransferase [Candidatus Roizmanbacteria bacterium]
MNSIIQIRERSTADSEWICSAIKNDWGSEVIVSRGHKHEVSQLPAYIAEIDGQKAGLLTYDIQDNQCEIVTLDSFIEGKGVATMLIQSIIEMSKKEKCKRIWLITTNDNTDALRFYQKRGFVLSAIYPNAIESSRKIKPEIPLIGANNISIRDEIELEMVL